MLIRLQKFLVDVWGVYSLVSSLGHRDYVPVSVDRCHAIIDSFMGTVQAKTLLFFVSKWPTIKSTFQCVVSLLKGGNRGNGDD